MKNSKKTIYSLIFLLLSITALQSQDKKINWRDMNGNKNATLYEIQENFYQYWQSKSPKKGQGYKVFKRWENYMVPRVYPSGNLLLPSSNYQNYIDWQSEKSSSSSFCTTSNWTSLGPSSIPIGYDAASGRVDFVRFDPTNTNTIYVGAPDGGLWKSTNAGASWTTNTDFLSIIGCSDIAIDPTNTQIMYLATGNWEADRRSIGVLKSTDGGATWNTTSLTWTASDNYKIRKLLMHPSNPSIMMAVTDGGIFRTTDGWATNSNVYCCNGLYDIEFKPGDPNIVYAAGQDFWKSTDNGATWTPVTTGLPASSSVSRMMLAISPANAAYVYIIAGNSTHGYLATYRSTDSGASFATRSTSPNILGYEKANPGGDTGQAGHDLAIVVSPIDANLVTIGGINAWQSTDGGVTWVCVAYWLGTDSDYPGQGDGPPDYVHADVQDLQYLPGSSSTLFATSDGGIYKSINNGGNWTKLSGNLSVAQQTGIALSASDPNLVVTGLQDIGTLKRSGSTWSGINGGDGEDAFIDRTNNLTIVTSNPLGAHDISFDCGATRAAILGLPTGNMNALFFSPISQDPDVATTIYAGGRSALYRKTDLFTNNDGVWETLGTPPGNGFILRYVVAPSNNTIIYAIKENAVSKSTDSGLNWTDITGSLANANAMLSNIAVSSTDPLKVWITYSGYSNGEKVFKTTDGGSTWINLSTGLPNLPINTVVIDNSSPNEAVYIGADIGIYYTDNTAGSNWFAFNTGFPNCAVTDLEIYYPENKIRASTYGRGAWESGLAVVTSPVANAGNDVSIPLGQSTTLMASGGSMYLWSTGQTSADITVSPVVNTQYFVTVTDTNGCTGTDEVWVFIVTCSITSSLSKTDETVAGANDGTITVMATCNGTCGTLQYSLNGGAAQSNNVFAGLTPGTYTVVTSNAGAVTCSDTQTITINAGSAPTCNISSTLAKTDESAVGANDGTITVTATCTGACGTLQYSLNGGTPQASNTFTGLAPGTYTVVSSNIGAATCSDTKMITINAGSAPSCNITSTLAKTDETTAGANNGTITVTATCTGACGTLQYSLNGGTPQASNTFTGLAPGTYTVMSSNIGAATCSDTKMITINAAPPTGGEVYVIVATDDRVKLERSIVHSGGVGVMKAGEEADIEDDSDLTAPGTFVKAPVIEIDNSSSVTNQILAQANPVLPTFRENNTNPNNDVDVDEGETVILDGSVYEDIEAGHHATLIFAGEGDVYIEDLKTRDDVTIIFNQCTNLIISGRMTLGKDNEFNKHDTQPVTVFVEKSITINKRSEVYATLYSADKLSVKKSSATQSTKMYGLFIAEEVVSYGYVGFWAQSFTADCPNTITAPIIAGNGAITEEPIKAIPPVAEIKSGEVAKQNNTKNLSFKIYPNPATDRVTIKLGDGFVGKTALIQIFNLQGQVVAYRNFMSLENNEITFNLIDAVNGIYMLMIQTDGTPPITKTFILQNMK